MLSLLLVSLLSSPQAPAPPAAGIYESLQLAVDPTTGALTGYFFDQTGRGQFTCAFLLFSDGKAATGGIYKIATWSPDPVAGNERSDGTLTVTATSITLQLPANAHGGCGNVDPDLSRGKPATYRLTSPRPWLEERLVRAQKLSFYSRPILSARTAAYVVQGDAVAVTARQGSWLHVDYQAPSGKITSAWVQSKGLAASTPPAF